MDRLNIKNMLITSGITLDDDQINVILDESEKLLVIAGAGSGKTTTMIAKTYYLVKHENIEEYSILMIAFTNEAVNEMISRLNNLGIYSVNVMTFHKLGLIILQMIDEDIKVIDSKIYLKMAILELWKDDAFKIDLIKILNHYYGLSIKKIRLNKLKWEVIENSNELDNLICFIIGNIDKKINIVNSNKKIINTLSHVCFDIINKYNNILSNQHLVDFNKIITNSANILLNKKLEFNIRYVFVDEYQDISKERFELLNNFVNKLNCKLIAVGDDWQSIYHFAGSDIKLFTKFKEIFKNSNVKYLNNTYRNSQQLINITGKIIYNNKHQFTKKLLSNKVIADPIKLYYYFSKTRGQCLEKILNKIIKESNSVSIMIIGRYKLDIEVLSTVRYINHQNGNHYLYKRLNLYFYTIHSAKGLGSEEVIILNMNRGKYGFPSEVKDELIKTDLFDKEENNIEEERRLLYVALTRTKNRVYIMVPYFNKSIFVKELKKTL